MEEGLGVPSRTTFFKRNPFQPFFQSLILKEVEGSGRQLGPGPGTP